MNRRNSDVPRQSGRPNLDVSLSPPSNEWMPLADAATVLRAAHHGSDLDRMSQGLSNSEEGLLAFWAQRVAQIGVPVYGCRIMSTRLEVVPARDMLTGRIIDQATRLDIGRGEPTQDFCVLQVKRREFEVALERVGRDAGPAA